MATQWGARDADRAAERPDDVVTRDPLNVHTSWAGLRSRRTPTSEFCTRNHFEVPRLDAAAWRLRLQGERDVALSLPDLRGMPTRTMDVVLECAGNGRSHFDPATEGTPWGERAVGCATFTGVPLPLLLDRAGVPADAVELVFRGADGGATPFERSLPVDVALADDTIVALEMNDAPLLPRHGAPARLVVPGWYGVASVKWLVGVRASATPFAGHFQTERYLLASREGDPAAVPVREKRVNSLIATPRPGAVLPARAPVRVTGWAWSGLAEIVRVDVSADGGRSWRSAELDPPGDAHAWIGWSATIEAPAGEVVLLARATDALGNAQPDRAAWNVHGYGNNAPRPRVVRVAALPLA